MKPKNIFNLVCCLLPLGLMAQEASKEVKSEPKAVSPELPTWRIPNMGEAAEFYFSPDSKSLIGNAKMGKDTIHQVYTVNIDGTNIREINSVGADACSYYFPDGKRLVFTSTKDHLDMHLGNYSDANDYPQGAELYTCDLDGSNVKRLTNNKYYDAEVGVSPDGKWILFTRQIDGKLDLWKMKSDGTGETQITHTPEWQEGGSFYMYDSKTILFRAWKRSSQGKKGMPMTIFTIKDDGTDLKQITTDTVATHWAPHPCPDGRHFVYVKVLQPRNFEIFLRDIVTGEEKQLTFNEKFDGFPVISPDGKLLVYGTGRDNAPGERKLVLYLMDVSSLNLGEKKKK
ncbi:MAG: PD40 domain-containing protein [Bacteroidetes bacterium]|nr:PD40 domain-containing protein [Bacteroidota bacterium]